jgi:tyrosinase
MKQQDQKRREFLRMSMLAIGAATLPIGPASAQLPQFRRLEWQNFKTTPQYNALRFAISQMVANTNPVDPNSWRFWVNAHINYCPHNVPYFLGWHRGFLYYFERQLRSVSGDSKLVLPYWDYYTNPNIPAEFTDATPGNPLWVSRVNTNVQGALTLAPFSPALINFQRGTANAFEPSMEDAPHNPVHDIIGSWMTTMESPVDPLFWLHHSNVDRLWVAWVAARAGRTMPAKTNSYWGGSFRYGSLSISRRLTYDTRSSLNYYYQTETMPASLPSLTAEPGMMRAARPEEQALLSAPPVGSYALSNPRASGDTTFSAAGSLGVGLDERPVSVQLPLSAEYGQAVAEIARGRAAPAPGGVLKFKSVHLVLDNVELISSGRNGGYFYKVYINLPSTGGLLGSAVTSTQIGTVGPFRIAGAAHHHGGPSKLSFVLNGLLAGLSSKQLGMLTISFVRVNGDNSPRGQVMAIGEARIELSTLDEQS